MAFTKIAAAGIGTTETVTVDGLTVINNGSFGGNLSVGGTLTYEDVTNVDSVGLITARNGIVVGSGITLSKDGDVFTTGITTFSDDVNIIGGGDLNITGGNGRLTVSSNLDSVGIFTSTDSNATLDLFDNDTQTRIRTIDGRLHLSADHLNGVADSEIRFIVDNINQAGIDANGHLYFRNDTDTYFHRPDTNKLAFVTADSERLRIDANGRVLIGHDTSVHNTSLQVLGATGNTSSISLSRFSNSAASPLVIFNKSRNATVGSNTVIQNNDTIGIIRWSGADGTDYSQVADIQGQIDGSPGDNDTPGRLVFSTTSDGASTTTERLRIDSNGDVSIGSDTNGGSNRLNVVDNHTDAFVNPTDSILRITNENTSGTTGQASISFTSQTTGSNADSAIVSQAEDASGNSRLEFWTDTSNGMTEKMAITAAGYMSRPLHPNFCARMTGSQNVSAQDVVIYDSVSSNYRRWNIGGHYSTTTGKFTAPIDGIYYFEGQVMTTGWSNNDNIQDLIFLNSSQGNVSYPRQRRSYFRTEDDANGYFTNSCAGQVQLSSGDTVWVQIQKACSVTSQQFCYFTGWLVQ
jgi:hypothetical protein